MLESAQRKILIVETCELRKAHVVQRATDGEVHALPGLAYAAGGLNLAVTLARRAVGDRDGSLERIEDGGGRNGLGRTRQ